MQTRVQWANTITLLTAWGIIVLVLLGSQCSGAIERESPCCPGKTHLDLSVYECKDKNGTKVTNGTSFPKCSTDEIFINEPFASISSKIEYLNDWCTGRAKQSSSEKIVIACVSKKNLINVSSKPTIPKCCPMFHCRMNRGCFASAECPKFENYHFQVQNVNIQYSPCTSLDLIEADDFGNIELLPNGSLYLPKAPPYILHSGQFCYEKANLTFGCRDNIVIPTPIAPSVPEDQNWVDLLVAIGLIVSIVFLLATFLIYACELKEQNLYGKTLMCHIGSIIVAFSCLAALKLSSTKVPFSYNFCTNFLPFLMMFFFHSAFFWLNVMSIDIWRTFRSIRSVDSVRRTRKMLRFTMYSIYAWGLPVIIIVLTIVAVKLPVLPATITPIIQACWISREQYGYHLFFIAPIASVISSNVIMYVITAYKCHQVKKEINKMHYADKINKNKFSKNKEQLILNIKLFLVMGLTWSMEVISYLAKRQGQSISLRYMWYVPDIMNSLYGLILFVIFALKKKNIRRLTRQVSTWMNKKRTESEDLRKISTSVNPSSVNNTLMDTTVMDTSH